MYYRGAKAAIVVYDITSADSFASVKDWVAELTKKLQSNIVISVVGNKCDLSAERAVPRETAEEYSDSIHARYFETSARADIGIQELFATTSKGILALLEPTEKPPSGLVLGQATPNASPPDSCAC
jgi:Ras-related protein Rab-5C